MISIEHQTKIITLSTIGISRREIAKHLKISHATVTNWLRRFNMLDPARVQSGLKASRNRADLKNRCMNRT